MLQMKMPKAKWRWVVNGTERTKNWDASLLDVSSVRINSPSTAAGVKRSERNEVVLTQWKIAISEKREVIYGSHKPCRMSS